MQATTPKNAGGFSGTTLGGSQRWVRFGSVLREVRSNCVQLDTSIGRKTVPLHIDPVHMYSASQKAHRDQNKAPVVVPTSTFERKADHQYQNAVEIEDGLTFLASDNEEQEAAAEDLEDKPGRVSTMTTKHPCSWATESSVAAEH
jgi:hypothetical protein